MTLAGHPCLVTRSGYTGEDGFEISLPRPGAPALAERLLAEPEVVPIGLGARDSLRLEAGLCLYGHDIDETTTPIEAGLAWTIGKSRREEAGFPGAAVILRQLAEGAAAQARRHPPRRPRAGARGRRRSLDHAGNAIGRVTSGGFGPSVGAPVAMGYVDAGLRGDGHARSTSMCAAPRAGRPEVARLPFVPHRYHRAA